MGALTLITIAAILYLIRFGVYGMFFPRKFKEVYGVSPYKGIKVLIKITVFSGVVSAVLTYVAPLILTSPAERQLNEIIIQNLNTFGGRVAPVAFGIIGFMFMFGAHENDLSEDKKDESK